MTLGEYNKKIQELEEEIKRLKYEKKMIFKSNNGVDFDILKEQWKKSTMKIVEKERKIMSRSDFVCRHRMVYEDGTYRWKQPFFDLSENIGWLYTTKNIDDSKHLKQYFDLIWRYWLGKEIKKLTNGKHVGLYNKKTGECNLTEEQISELEQKMKWYIDDWVRQWES